MPKSIGHVYRGPEMTTIRVYNELYATRSKMLEVLKALPAEVPVGKDNAFWFDSNGEQTALAPRVEAPAPAVVGRRGRGRRAAAGLDYNALAAAIVAQVGLSKK